MAPHAYPASLSETLQQSHGARQETQATCWRALAPLRSKTNRLVMFVGSPFKHCLLQLSSKGPVSIPLFPALASWAMSQSATCQTLPHRTLRGHSAHSEHLRLMVPRSSWKPRRRGARGARRSTGSGSLAGLRHGRSANTCA